MDRHLKMRLSENKHNEVSMRKDNDLDGSDLSEEFEDSIEFPNINQCDRQSLRKEANCRKAKEIRKQTRMLR